MLRTHLANAALVLLLLAVAASGACGEDSATTDAGIAIDAATSIDATQSADGARATDAVPSDAASAVVDGSAVTDAVPAPDAVIIPDASLPPDAGACHGVALVSPAVALEQVGTLPTMTGGAIPLGIYDAVAFKMITSTTTGTYRAAWSFDSATTLHTVQQIALNGGTPPPPMPRTATYSTSGATLTQTRTCAGDTTLSSGYTVRTEGAATLLDIRENTIMFTFQKRP